VSIAFLMTTLIVVATPGTGVIYTLAAGLSYGRRASVVAAIGCTLGIVPHMVATITGIAALLQTSALAFQVLKYLGVAYLLYMAWATLKDKDAIVVEKATAPRSAARVIITGILINLLNPKLTMFFFAFLPQFVGTSEPDSLVRMLELSAVFMLLTLVISPPTASLPPW
jgi:threonine/homoserine/homoserine lactone efflux protein